MYSDLVHEKHHLIEDVDKWLWPRSDNGAWDGPHKEWPEHKKAYLKYTRDNRCVIQAGGNCGLYPRLLSNIFSLVYTFEPDPLNFHCLVNNCQKDSIIKFNCALGSNNSRVTVIRNSMENVGMHQVAELENSALPQVTIDSLNLEPSMISLDVEGFEANIILGALETIKKFTPLVVCERGGEQVLNLLNSVNPGYKMLDKIYEDYYYGVV